ncbi:MAG: methyltransferase domain-containing protein [Candidatus Nitrosopumilus sp. bin_7KS]
MNCRFCKSDDLELFLDLGHSPLGNRFLTKKELQEPEIYYPLQAYLCKNCKLSQLGYVPSQETVYNENYAYEAGNTKTRKKNHYELAKNAYEKFSLDSESLVVDIGSNVGMLLTGFKELGTKIQGVDASENVAQIARNNGIETITGFFGEVISKEILQKHNQKAKIITATNVFAHINDYDDFLNGVKELLADDGVFIFQVHYFVDLVKKLQYDMIFHEHILFESIKPLVTLFENHNMTLFDVERYEIDGGVIRCFVSKNNMQKPSPKINELIKEEEEIGIHTIEGLEDFSNRVNKHRDELVYLLNDLKKQNKKIAALSMPAKGVALLNFSKIDTRLIEFATEKTSLKIGKYAPGSHIPIKSDNELTVSNVDYALLLAWNFEKEIIENNQKFLEDGGKFIVPIPNLKIISKD